MRAMSVSCVALLLAVPAAAQSSGEATPPAADGEEGTLKIAAALGYDFNGKAKAANLLSEVFLGFDTLLFKKVRFRFGPTVASGGSKSDSASFFRSTMLPGNGSVSALAYGFLTKERAIRPFLGVGVGIKVIDNPIDTANALVQHNLRVGGGLVFESLMLVSAQFTRGWHDFTSNSERAFQSAFNATSTDVSYLMVSIEGYLPSLKSYLVMTWRGMQNGSDYPGFENDTRVISLGLRKELNIAQSFPTARANTSATTSGTSRTSR